MKIFISGVSSGIGKALCAYYLNHGHTVYGISRRKISKQSFNLNESAGEFHHIQADLLDHKLLPSKLSELFKDSHSLDMAILNAGTLGAINSIKRSALNDLKQVMETNLWSQKVLLDSLLDHCSELKTVIAISSGAGVRGNYGWSGYALSKAALNMLIQLYAAEFKTTSFYALAPGLVDTSMQETLSKISAKEYPNLERLHQARGTENMPKPQVFAPKFDQALQRLKKLESGSFADIRSMSE